ncbi:MULTISPECIES: hypothetical protein [unclassified Xanthomonas]|uniref:hypothetical protein n=1 Tax=unclassified Xanthomonas TaxID=2643310 RepID=UPI00160A24E7|nr:MULTISPECIES: hypothetical protein [unclassified Xanthomonas]MBB4132806.1 hypothetical protein [Xanthomonas sp. 3075]MBB5864218.1 hypothetical protein [Xanthomonas sp. 3058]
MRRLFARLLQRPRVSGQAQAPRGAAAHTATAHAQPRIEVGSTLHTMAELDPVAAAAFADAFAVEIEQSIATCALGDAATPQAKALEQIHALKNTISLTGSQPLLKACDQLRGDVGRHVPGDTLAHRFTAIATAAGLLVRHYRRMLPPDDTSPHV